MVMLSLAFSLAVSQAPLAQPEVSLMPRQQVLDELTAIETAWPGALPPAIGLGVSGGTFVLGLALFLTDTFRDCDLIFRGYCRIPRTTVMTDVGGALIGAGLVGLAITAAIFIRLKVKRSSFRDRHQVLTERIDALDDARSASEEKASD